MMGHEKRSSSINASSANMAPLDFKNKVHEKTPLEGRERAAVDAAGENIDIDLREVYFLIMHFLSAGPCKRTFSQFWDELLEHQLLPRRYHPWFSRCGVQSGDENDDGISFPLSYNNLVERFPHIQKDHLVKLLKQLLLSSVSPSHRIVGGHAPSAADVPTLLGTGSFSLLDCNKNKEREKVKCLPAYLNWPHMKADQVRGVGLREIGGGFTKHCRAPSILAACYAIAKPSSIFQKMQNIKKLRGHRNAVYCAIFDRSGRYVITGSDDRLVKIWSMETAFCLASCRGHEGDITDLAVSSNNNLVASASNDFAIRVWRLKDGLPISVLRGHTGAVTAIAFSPRPSSVYQLLSSSDDGTCRIWDARYSQSTPRIYAPKPSDVVAAKSNGPSSNHGPQSHQLLCCAYNASGTVFVTGSSDTFARVWNACRSSIDYSGQPHHEMDVLSGHENDVNYVQFSGCAVSSRYSTSDTSMKEENIPKFKSSWYSRDNIVTCSRDGSAIIWVPRSYRSYGKARWTKAYHLKVPPPPMPPQPPRGGPRQRLLPTPRGVNMIVWSLDNRFVLAAIMDCRICVWNAVDGSLVHSLTGHDASTYVLDVHPFNPRIAMSAGYDGKTIVWDIWEGTPIRVYEFGRFKLVDGKFSSDGTSIVLSDDVGQIYLLNTGQGESQKDAIYDQFFLGDYRPLIRDTQGNVIDQETQLVPYRRNIQDLLCDSSMIPYPEPYQSMYQQRRLGAMGIEWRPSSIDFAIGIHISLGEEYHHMLPLDDLDRIVELLPEFTDAMYWEPDNVNVSDDTDSEYNVAEEYSSEGKLGSLNYISSSDLEDSEDERDGLRRSQRKKQSADVGVMTSSGRLVKRRNLNEHDGSLVKSKSSKKPRNRRRSLKRKSVQERLLNQQVGGRNSLLRINETSTDEDAEGSESNSSDDELLLQNSNIQNQECTINSFDENKDVVEPSERLDSQENIGNRRRLILKISVRDSKKSVPVESIGSKCDNEGDLAFSTSVLPEVTASEIRNFRPDAIDVEPSQVKSEDEYGKYTSFQCSNMEGQHQKDDPGLVFCNSNLVNKYENLPESVECRYTDSVEPQAVVGASHSHGMEKSQPPNSKIKIRIKSRSDPKTPSKIKFITTTTNPTDAGGNLMSESTPVESQNHKVVVHRITSIGASKRPESPSMEVHEQLAYEESVSTSKRTTRSRSNRNREGTYYDIGKGTLAGSNSKYRVKKISWLMLSEHEEGYRYIPQKGDEVVYLRQGHQEYMESSQSSEQGPWCAITDINPVEICKVENLDYATLPGSGESCCKLTLRFTDPSSIAWNKSFKVTLPELIDFPDFIVEKTRYTDSIERNWTHRDKCRVWWRNEGGGGEWWEGRIIALKNKSDEFPDSPWERFVVQYKRDPANPHMHCPWELHDPYIQWEHPGLDVDSRNKLLYFFSKLEKSVLKNEDPYGVGKLIQVAEKLDFLNRFPVPLSPEVIQLRLNNYYYRSLEAAKHDVIVMVSNAQSYFGRNAEQASKIRRLSEWLTRKLSIL